MVVENIDFTADNISGSKKCYRMTGLSRIRSSEYRVACGYIRGYRRLAVLRIGVYE